MTFKEKNWSSQTFQNEPKWKYRSSRLKQSDELTDGLSKVCDGFWSDIRAYLTKEFVVDKFKTPPETS